MAAVFISVQMWYARIRMWEEPPRVQSGACRRKEEAAAAQCCARAARADFSSAELQGLPHEAGLYRIWLAVSADWHVAKTFSSENKISNKIHC